MKNKLLFLFTILFCTVSMCSCTTDNQVTRQGFYFDTVVNITVDESKKDAIDDAFRICASAENIFSRTKEDSELYNINKGNYSVLSEDMRQVLEFSLSVSEMSDGAFDITVAPLCDLWNIKERTVPPSKEETDAALSTVNYKNISLSPLDTSSVSIDLGAVAKGYVADKIAENFRNSGVERAIIDLGGNVALIGEYTVGITDPFSPGELYAKIKVKDKSAVTSGSYQRYFEHDGKRYHHIIDPRTGECADSGLASVTVISKSSMQADALSTAIFVLGKEGISLCKEFPDTDALLITNDGEIITTDGFEKKYSLELINK